MRRRIAARLGGRFVNGLLPLLLALSGCTQGIRWYGYNYPPVHAAAQRDGVLTFVYLRHWSVLACTEFEENVLLNPAVLQATNSLYCVPLDFHWDRPLADQWGIDAPPAVVIVAPDGTVLRKCEGVVSVDELLRLIQEARSEFESSRASPATP